MMRISCGTATCLVCLAEPVLLLREWLGLNVLAGDLSKPLIIDWLLLSGGGHTWGSIGSMCWGKCCMEFVMESEVVVCHGREHSTEGENKQSNRRSIHGDINLYSVYRESNFPKSLILANSPVFLLSLFDICLTLL